MSKQSDSIDLSKRRKPPQPSVSMQERVENYLAFYEAAKQDPSKLRGPKPPLPQPDAAEIVAPWDQRPILMRTPVSPEYCHLLYNLHLKTGKTIQELLDHAIEETYESQR